MNYSNYIEAGSAVMLGKPVIKGTRITVAFILKRLSEGAGQDELVKAYPSLTKNSIAAAIAYASDVVGNQAMVSLD